MAKSCESCGMPLSKDPAGGGTELDGSKSTVYCSYCYDMGGFRDPDMDVTEFQAACMKAMHEMGMSKFVAWILTRGIPRLPRWKS